MNIFFGLFCLSHLLPFTASSSEGIVEIQKLAHDVNTTLREISTRGVSSQEDSRKDLYRRMGNLMTNINETIQDIDNSEKKLIPAVSNWMKTNKQLRMEGLIRLKKDLDSAYKELDQYLKANYSGSIADLTERIAGKGPRSVEGIIGEIYNYLAPSEESDNAVNGLLKYLKEHNDKTPSCSLPLFPQQIIHSYYEFAMVAEIKSYVLQAFAYNYKEIVDNETHYQEIAAVEARYSDQTDALFEYFRKTVQKSSKILWICDPDEHILGETYEQMTKLIQGLILNEENLSSDGTCYQKCSNFKYVTKAQCRGDSWCNEQPRCKKIVDCVPTDSKLSVCLKTNGYGTRRYEQVQLVKKGKYWGENTSANSTCRKQDLDAFKQLLFFNCDYCFCKCVESNRFTDIFISLRAALANYKDNRVVTGIRFVKNNRIIHLQVQEGLLLPFAKINASSLRWVPVDDYKITDRKSYDGQDYHTFTFEERAIDLVNVTADPGHIVLGVRFKKAKGHVKLQVLQAPFNFTTGKLIDAKKNFKDHENGNYSKLELTEADIPIRSSEPSLPNSKSEGYIEFTHSDVEKDAAQTTVPFFDIQLVASLQPVPLSGVGIFYKGIKGYGGFVAPKIIAYNIGDHFVK